MLCLHATTCHHIASREHPPSRCSPSGRSLPHSAPWSHSCVSLPRVSSCCPISRLQPSREDAVCGQPHEQTEIPKFNVPLLDAHSWGLNAEVSSAMRLGTPGSQGVLVTLLWVVSVVPAPETAWGLRGHFPRAVGAGRRVFWRQLEPASLGNLFTHGDVLGVVCGFSQSLTNIY